MKQSLFICLLLLSGLLLPLSAQSSLDALQQPILQTAVCVWDGLSPRDQPGNKGKTMGTVYFGETVTLLGPSEVYEGDKRTYVLVRTADGKEGWVHEYLFVRNGVVGVITADLPVYKKPNSATTVTGTEFVAGDMVVMDQAEQDWVHLVTRRKERMGWAKVGDNITFEEADLEVAAMIYKAEQDSLVDVRVARLHKLQSNPMVTKSSLGPLIETRLLAYTDPGKATGTSTRSVASTPSAVPAGATARVSQPAGATARMTQPAGPTMVRQSVADINTGREYTKIVEEGKVLEVSGPASRTNELFCYHKTLPIGSEVYLTIPGNDGFVKLRVADRLGSGHQEVIAMSREGMKAFFGTTSPDRAQIVYYSSNPE